MKLRINRSRAGRVRINRVRIRRSWSAAVVACFGLFFVSAGVGLTATAANAAKPDSGDKVIVCHINEGKNPYVALEVDLNATGGPDHSTHESTWETGTWFRGVWHPAGSLRVDLIGERDGITSKEDCDGPIEGVRSASAEITITQQPACANDGVGRWEASATGATVNPANGTGGSGSEISATATAEPGYTFPGGQNTKTLSGNFASFDPASCDGGEPGLAAVTAPDIQQPTCASSGAWSWSIGGENVTFSPDASGSGTYADRASADTSVTVNAVEGYEFADGTTQKTIPVNFNFDYASDGQTINAAGGCDAVLPPDETPGEETPGGETPVVKPPVVLAPAAPAPVKAAQSPAKAKVKATVIPTLVNAGLPGAPSDTAAPTSQSGTALTGMGLMLLAMAGGIAFLGRRHERV